MYFNAKVGAQEIDSLTDATGIVDRATISFDSSITSLDSLSAQHDVPQSRVLNLKRQAAVLASLPFKALEFFLVCVLSLNWE